MKTIFEDVIDGTKNAVDKVSRKTIDIVDISKLRLNASEINNEIRKRFESIGRIVYEADKEETDIEQILEENYKNIDILYKRLESINEKIAKYKNKSLCHACGKLNERKAVYCSSCGEKIH